MPIDLDALIAKTRKVVKKKVQGALFDLDALIEKTAPPKPVPVRQAPRPTYPVRPPAGPGGAVLRKPVRPLPAWGVGDILVHRESGKYGVVDAILPLAGDNWMVPVKVLAKDGRVFSEARFSGADTSIDAWRALAPDLEYGDPVLAKWVARRRRRISAGTR